MHPVLTIELDPALREFGDKDDGKHVFAKGETVSFGREPPATIRFPGGDNRLGGAHFELKPVVGSYEVVTDGEHPVYANGVAIFDRMKIVGSAEVKLIDPGSGPTIRITVGNSAIQRIITNPEFKNVKPTFDALLRGYVRKFAVLFLALALAGLGYAVYNDFRTRDLYRLADETKQLIATLGARIDETKGWADIIKEKQKSVYQVAVMRNDLGAPDIMGTAWVIDDHTLITNAHVAVELRGSKSHQLVVIAPDGKQMPLEVKDENIKLHPAYMPFDQAITAIDPNKAVKRVGSYDLAMLILDKQLMKDKNIVLAPALSPASADELSKLRPGDEIALIGYPVESAKNENMVQARFGHISGFTDFLGMTQGMTGELVYHTADVTSGSSGSIILNKDGKVVAVHSGGEKRLIGDVYINSGASTYFAQSAALIDDIGAAWDEAKLRKAIADWTSAALYLARKNEVWWALQNYRNGKPLVRIDFPVLDKSEQLPGQGAATFEMNNVGPGTYVVFAVVRRNENISLRVSIGGSTILSPLYLDSTPTTVFKTDTNRSVQIAVTGKPGTSFTLQVHQLPEDEPDTEQAATSGTPQ